MSSTLLLQVPRCTRCSIPAGVGTDQLLRREVDMCLLAAGEVEGCLVMTVEVEALLEAGNCLLIPPWTRSQPSADSADFGWNSDLHWSRDSNRDLKSNTVRGEAVGEECNACGTAPGVAWSTSCGESTTPGDSWRYWSNIDPGCGSVCGVGGWCPLQSTGC